MKVLFTVSTYKPHADGIQFVTSYLAEGLVKRGHKVDLIAYECPDLTSLKVEEINGVRVIRWNAKTVHMLHKGDKNSYQQYILKEQYNYDIMINVGTQTALTDWLFPIFDNIKIPKILHLHSVWNFKIVKKDFLDVKSFLAKIIGNLRWGFYYIKFKNIFKQYDTILQLHEKEYGYVFFEKKYGIKSTVLENAAEKEFFETDLCKKQKYILNVSNYRKVKNQIESIKVFLKSNLDKEWNLILVGSKKTDYYNKMIEYYNKLELEQRNRIKIMVGIPRNEVYELVKKCKIYMMTSIWEAFPISIIEAMAAKVPFISSDVGIVKYLPGGIVAKNESQFVNALERLANDDAYREKLGEEGYNAAFESYQIEPKVSQLEQILEDVMKKYE